MGITFRGKHSPSSPHVSQYKSGDLRKIYVDEQLYRDKTEEVNTKFDSLKASSDIDNFIYIPTKYEAITEELCVANNIVYRRLNDGNWVNINTHLNEVISATFDDIESVNFDPDTKILTLKLIKYNYTGEVITSVDRYTVVKDCNKDIKSDFNLRSDFKDNDFLSTLATNSNSAYAKIFNLAIEDYTAVLNFTSNNLNITANCDIPYTKDYDLSTVDGNCIKAGITGSGIVVFYTDTNKLYKINGRKDLSIQLVSLPVKTPYIGEHVIDFDVDKEDSTVHILTDKAGLLEYNSYQEKFLSDSRFPEDLLKITIDNNNNVRVYGLTKSYQKFHRGIYQEEELNFPVDTNLISKVFFNVYELTDSIELDNLFYAIDSTDQLLKYNFETSVWDVVDTLTLDGGAFPDAKEIIIHAQHYVFDSAHIYCTVADVDGSNDKMIFSQDLINWTTDTINSAFVSANPVKINDYHITEDGNHYLVAITEETGGGDINKLIHKVAGGSTTAITSSEIPELVDYKIKTIDEIDGVIYITINDHIYSSSNFFTTMATLY